MNHWPFVLAAYATVGLGTAGLLIFSIVDMRRQERRASRINEQS